MATRIPLTLILTVNGSVQIDALFTLEDTEELNIIFTDYMYDSDTHETFYENAGGLWL